MDTRTKIHDYTAAALAVILVASVAILALLQLPIPDAFGWLRARPRLLLRGERGLAYGAQRRGRDNRHGPAPQPGQLRLKSELRRRVD